VRDLLLVGLTFASGAADAIAFLGLDKVFTAFMTGNLVFLGLGLSGADGPNITRVLAALGPFAVGVFVAVRIVSRTKNTSLWPRPVTVVLGLAAIAEAAFAIGWAVTSGHPSDAAGDALIAFSAFAFGAQSGAVMSLGVKGIFTTAATATVIMLARDEATAPETGVERRRLAGVLLGLVLGAATGAFLLVHARTFAPLVTVAVTAFVVAVAATTIGRRT
jgi:uncharacterized membrane protein YoaK (UPF0700 family)